MEHDCVRVSPVILGMYATRPTFTSAPSTKTPERSEYIWPNRPAYHLPAVLDYGKIPRVSRMVNVLWVLFKIRHSGTEPIFLSFNELQCQGFTIVQC